MEWTTGDVEAGARLVRGPRSRAAFLASALPVVPVTECEDRVLKLSDGTFRPIDDLRATFSRIAEAGSSGARDLDALSARIREIQARQVRGDS